MTNIKYPEEIRQADILKKLEQLQAKANRRRQPISKHYSKQDNQSDSLLVRRISPNHPDIPDIAA
uniref:Uncharacterized protein n=1 Tax=viral metagenome TaxID=1070528 RepID=A0A6M3LDD7_9ZZZZ